MGGRLHPCGGWGGGVVREAGCIGMGRFSCSLLVHQLAVCLYHRWADLPLPSLVSGIENWKENVEQQEGVKCSSFHAQHLAFGDECGILLWTEGMLWKAAQFEAVSPVHHQRESGPSNKKQWGESPRAGADGEDGEVGGLL